MTVKSFSESDTIKAAQELAKSLTGGEIITLEGELGAGKTVFVKGLCAYLGVKEDVLSPTFTIMNDYDGDKLKVYHYDAYRLADGEEAYYSGLTEFFGKKDGVCVIEWAQNIESALNGFELIKVRIRYLGENKREIEIS